MGGYFAYAKCKNSGVKWLGEIPSHWRVKRLKFSLSLINEKVDADSSTLVYMGLEHIESWTGERIDDEHASSEGTASHFLPGDVLFGKLRPYLAKVHLSKHEGLASTEALVLRSNHEISPEFFRYYAVSRDFIDIVDSSTFGAKMPRASWNFIGNLSVLVPPLSEQQQIAAFLDYKTAQIDALIAKKEALLEKLAEKRTALISQAVTKGLDPTVPMKDSGIEWLGEIPAHWEAKRFKFLVSEPLKYGANEAAELDDPDLPRYIRITDIKDNGILREDTFRSLPNNIAKDYLLQEGDILLARSGATVGKNFIYKKTWGKAAYAGYLIRARISSWATGQFFYKCLQSNFYQEWVKSIFIQATIQNISAEKYANLWLPVPLLLEQKRIVDFLDYETTQSDTQIEKTKAAIERLREYRTALITNAVTGKIDVRDIKLPEPTLSKAA